MLSLIGAGIGLRAAIGKAIVFDHEQQKSPKYRIDNKNIQSEIKRFQSALDRTQRKLQQNQKNLSDNAQAFIDVHLLILKDPMISQQPIQSIKNYSYNAEWALEIQAEKLAARFSNIKDSYLRSKKNDVQQVIDRILNGLRTETDARPTNRETNFLNCIVVTNDLMPADVVTLHDLGVTAFVTRLGGPISHTAILARSLGIPTVVGLHHAIKYIKTGDFLAVDGHTGTVLVNPDHVLLVKFQQRQSKQLQREKELATLRDLPSITRDGYLVDLHANIELREDIDALERFGGDNVGLYRTEFLFMNRAEPPDEKEQYETYKKVIKSIGGQITIRTLDLGADKQVDGGRADGATKVNPALGLRAIRLCLSEPNLFKPQLRAILRASVYGHCRIMIPMLSSLSEIQQILDIVQEVKRDLTRAGLKFDTNVPIGGMIEVPAAAISADLFAKQLDFLSIGTNDLIQYTLAVDRIDDEVNYLYDPLHPSVLRLIHNVIRAGHDAGIPVSMCGEMAGDSNYTRLLLGLGLLEFSMAPPRLFEIKERVRTSHRATLMSQVWEILDCSNPTQARMIIDKLNAQTIEK